MLVKNSKFRIVSIVLLLAIGFLAIAFGISGFQHRSEHKAKATTTAQAKAESIEEEVIVTEEVQLEAVTMFPEESFSDESLDWWAFDFEGTDELDNQIFVRAGSDGENSIEWAGKAGSHTLQVSRLTINDLSVYENITATINYLPPNIEDLQGQDFIHVMFDEPDFSFICYRPETSPDWLCPKPNFEPQDTFVEEEDWWGIWFGTDDRYEDEFVISMVTGTSDFVGFEPIYFYELTGYLVVNDSEVYEDAEAQINYLVASYPEIGQDLFTVSFQTSTGEHILSLECYKGGTETVWNCPKPETLE